jgi:hypothetical protein
MAAVEKPPAHSWELFFGAFMLSDDIFFRDPDGSLCFNTALADELAAGGPEPVIAALDEWTATGKDPVPSWDDLVGLLNSVEYEDRVRVGQAAATAVDNCGGLHDRLVAMYDGPSYASCLVEWADELGIVAEFIAASLEMNTNATAEYGPESEVFFETFNQPSPEVSQASLNVEECMGQIMQVGEPVDAPPSNPTWTLPAFDGSVLPVGATAKALGPERLEYVDLCQGGDCETDIRLSVDGIPLYMEVDWIYLPSNGGPVVLSYFLNPDHLAVGPEFMWALERGSADGKIYLSDSLHFSVPDDEELLSVCWSDSYGGPVVAIVTGVTAPVSIDRAWVFKWQPSSSWPGLEGTWLGLDEALIDPQTVLVPPFPGNALPACGI